MALAHGLMNWWIISNVSGGFWVMEPTKLTQVERFAEALTLLLNLPSLVVTYVFGFPPFAFTKPVVAIFNSCLYGAALARLAFAARQ